MLSALSQAPAWPSARLIAPCSALPSLVMLARNWIGGPLGALLEHSRAF